MTETLMAVTSLEKADTDAAAASIEVPVGREVDELEVARELVRQARDAGVSLTVLALIENDQCCSLKVTTLALVQGSAM